MTRELTVTEILGVIKAEIDYMAKMVEFCDSKIERSKQKTAPVGDSFAYTQSILESLLARVS